MVRCTVNIDMFNALVGVISPALQYFQNLEQKYLGVWHQLPAGKKLARRLLVDGEASLRTCFLAAFEQCGRNVSALNFMETHIGSDFAMVEERLMKNYQDRKAEEAVAAVLAEAAKRAAAGDALQTSPESAALGGQPSSQGAPKEPTTKADKRSRG